MCDVLDTTCKITGCQFCHAPRIRKFYAEFGVRSCKDCLYARTISDECLINDYLVEKLVLKRLRFITMGQWNHHEDNYMQFYWKASVEKRLGMTLEEYAERQKRINNEKVAHMLSECQIKLMEQLHQAISSEPFDLAFVEKNLNHTDLLTCHVYIDTDIPNYIAKSTLKIISKARNIWHGQLLDANIKRETRARGYKIGELRKSAVYADRVNKGLHTFTVADWTTLKMEQFNDGVNELIRSERININTNEIHAMPAFQEFRQQMKVPTPEQWSVIVRPIKEKTAQLKKLASIVDVKFNNLRGYNKIKMNCPYCPRLENDKVLFIRAGLHSHVIDAHFNKKYWPNEIPNLEVTV